MWSQIRTSVGAFMQDLFWRGAFHQPELRREFLFEVRSNNLR